VEDMQIFKVQIFSSHTAPISASIRPHKKSVKKIEAQGAKEKQVLLLPSFAGIP
jgi:hypothetical protein